MLVDQVRKLGPMDRLVYWIKERQSIRLKRLKGQPKPWTDDEILQSYRFCNVRRMDDTVSQWLLYHWYTPNYNHKNMLVAVVLARFFNLPSTLSKIGFPRTLKIGELKSKLRYLTQWGPIFNSAYMVRGNDGVDKVSTVIDYTLMPLIGTPPRIDRDSMQKTWEQIECRYGFGSFMAGQVVADLRWGLAGDWKDRKVWAPKGPGSSRGLNRLLGLPLNHHWKQDEFIEELRKVIRHCRENLPIKVVENLEAIDYQNCLCEFDKYERTLFDGRRPKRRFQGAS